MSQTPEEREQAWGDGYRAANLRVFRECLKHLKDMPEADNERWVLEREEAIMVLRQLCATHGDNDWEPSLNLADIIDKHLARHLPPS